MPKYPLPFVLREVITAYGAPSHVIAGSSCGPDAGSGERFWLVLIYLERGILLGPPAVDNGHGQPALSADMLLNQVVFFVPGIEGLRAVVYLSPEGPTLRTWEGFRSFEFYLNGDMAGKCPEAIGTWPPR